MPPLPLQQYQVQTQPHKQEMTYLQPPPSYAASNQSFTNSLTSGYLEAPPTDSGFVSDNSLSQQKKSEAGHDSDSGHSLGDAATVVTTGPTRRGPFKTQHDRDQTAQTRKDGCCLRCRHQKIRVCFLIPISCSADDPSVSQIPAIQRASASPART
jgi:hypothetical protein